uniref:Uncharacterized protein n=1 Tax=Anguilla anguilla TaxID=7936 RepID=A0A0E9RJU4_ANGAN
MPPPSPIGCRDSQSEPRPRKLPCECKKHTPRNRSYTTLLLIGHLINTHISGDVFPQKHFTPPLGFGYLPPHQV